MRREVRILEDREEPQGSAQRVAALQNFRRNGLAEFAPLPRRFRFQNPFQLDPPQ